jgi:hypothetical protein
VEIETKTRYKLKILECDSHARAEILASVITTVCNMEETARSKSGSVHDVFVEKVTRISGVDLVGYMLLGLIALLTLGGLSTAVIHLRP